MDEESKSEHTAAENEASVSGTSQILSQSSHKTLQRFHKQPFNMHPCKHTHTHTGLSDTLVHKHWRHTAQENNDEREAYLSCLAQFCSISVLSFTNFTYFSTSSRPDCVCFSMMSYWSWRKGACKTNKEKILSKHSAGCGTWVITGIFFWLSLRSSKINLEWRVINFAHQRFSLRVGFHECTPHVHNGL